MINMPQSQLFWNIKFRISVKMDLLTFANLFIAFCFYLHFYTVSQGAFLEITVVAKEF